MKYLLAFALVSAVLAASGCADIKAPVVPPAGIVFANYKAPLMTRFTGDDLGDKEGTAVVHNVFIWPLYSWLSLTWDSAAVRKAAAQGNITVIKGADYEYLNVLWVYRRLTIHVYGS